MNDRQLRYACAVWRARSFSRAAEKLHVSQPSLSDQVKLLEEEIGFPIFYRSARGVDTSVNGQVFLEKAEQVLFGMTGLATLGEELRGRVAQIRIGLNSGIADLLLPEAMQILTSGELAVRYAVVTATNRRIQRLVEEEKLDIGLLLGADGETLPKRLVAHEMTRSALLLVVAPAHALARRKDAIDLAEIARLPMVVNEPLLGFGRAALALFEERGLKPDIVADCDNIETLKSMVASDAGIAILPAVCIERERREGTLVALALGTSRDIPVRMIRRAEAMAPRVEEWLERLIPNISAASDVSA